MATEDLQTKKSRTKSAAVKSLCGRMFKPGGKKTWNGRVIKEDVLELEAAAMFDKDIFGSGKRWIEEFIYNYLYVAMKDPTSVPAQKLAGAIFNETTIDQITTLTLGKEKKNLDFTIYCIRKTLYDRQQEVFDNETDKRILIINSRRSGKTELMGRLIAKGLLKPDAHVVYINRTSSAAIRQIAKPLETAINATNGELTISSGSVESQEIHFTNGGQLLIIGNNNSGDINKLRGERISLCIMDECGHQRNTRQLIREVIGPALTDYADSKLVLVGTPPRIPHTYVEECWDNPAWKKYSWTFQDNPFIPNKENVIKEVCEENGVDENAAFIQREYFGRMDAYDDDAKWIKKYSIVEPSQLSQTQTWTHAYVGVDWGFEDKAAVISVLADSVSKRAYVVDCWSEAKKGITEISNEIKRQVEQLKSNYAISRPVQVICDNNEKGAVADLVKVYKLKNVYCAYKYDKDLALDQLNDFLSSNRITFLKDHCASLVEDASNSLWKRDDETDKILHELDDDLWHPNSLMALLYVSRHFAYDVCRYTDINKIGRNILNDMDPNEGLQEIYNDVD